MFNFNINWEDVIKVLVPPVYRTIIHQDWLKAIFKPISTLYASFLIYRQDTMYFTSITFQKVAIEKMLNDLYDNVHRRIYLEDASKITTLYISNKRLGYPPVYIYSKAVPSTPVYVYTKATYAAEYDFIIYIPAMIYSLTNINQLKSYVDQYKFAGKRYQILTF